MSVSVGVAPGLEDERRDAGEDVGGGRGREEAAPWPARRGEGGERAEARDEPPEDVADHQVREVAPFSQL